MFAMRFSLPFRNANRCASVKTRFGFKLESAMDLRRENLLAELKFMKDLFDKHLPVGSNREDINKYFSCLEELIFTKDPDDIQREEFPPDDPATSGSREYRYYSADQFKKLAGGYQQFPSRQDLGHAENKQEELPPTENRSSDTQDVAHIQEHTDGRGISTNQWNPCPDIQGQLDRGNTSQLPDGKCTGGNCGI
jgi:hypothetical protein